MLFVAILLLAPVSVLAAPLAFVTSQHESNVRLIDTATDGAVGEPIAVGDGPLAIALNPSGTRAYATSTMGGAVSVIDTAAGEVIKTIPLSFYALGVAVTLDEKRVYVVTNFDESLWEIDAETNKVVGEKIRFGGGVTLSPSYVALSPDGTRAYVSNLAGSVSVIDLVERKPIGMIEGVGGGPVGIVTSPDGKRLYTVTQNGGVAILDTAAKAVDGDVIMRSNALFIGVAISPEGNRLYIPDARNGELLIFDTEARVFLDTDLDIGPASEGIALTGDGKRAYTAGHDHVRVIDTVGQVVAPNPITLSTGLRGIAIQPPAPCAGDCRRKGSVTVDDLVTAYLVSSGAKPEFYCALVDADDDGEVTTGDLTTAVTRALGGCGG